MRQYPLPVAIISGAIVTLLVTLQFNWAFTNNFYSDLPLRIAAAVPIAILLSIPYARMLITFLSRLTAMSDEKKMLTQSSYFHLPLYILWLFTLHTPYNGLIVAAGAGLALVLFWYFFIYPNENTIKGNIINNAGFFLMVAGTVAALAARYIFIPQVSMDTANWVMPWLNYIKKHGISAYGDIFSNYSPFYTYLLGIGSLLPLTDLEIIKYISIAFELMAARYIYLVIKLRYPGSPMMPRLAFVSFLFLPTVLINSSYWGQCDIIYVAFCIAAVYYLMLPDTRRNNLVAVALFSLALSVKLQAVLIAPLFAIAWAKRDIKLTDFLLIPATYILLMVPCLLLGRGFKELLLVYFTIVDKNPVLTANSPNIYQMVGYNLKFTSAGVMVAIGIQAILIFSVLHRLKNRLLDIDLLVHLAFFVTLTMPFLMPRMHERYFLMAECIALLYAFFNPKHFYMPLLLGFISFFTYTEFLFAFVLVPFHWLMLGVLAIILIVGYALLQKLDKRAS